MVNESLAGRAAAASETAPGRGARVQSGLAPGPSGRTHVFRVPPRSSRPAAARTPRRTRLSTSTPPSRITGSKVAEADETNNEQPMPLKFPRGQHPVEGDPRSILGALQHVDGPSASWLTRLACGASAVR